MLLDTLFDEYLTLSAKYRSDYTTSLGVKKGNWMEVLKLIFQDVPRIYETLYGRVSGTRRDIKRQELMDFIPGYRLIHIDELIHEKSNLDFMIKDNRHDEFEVITPLLANYSSDFICYARTNNGKEVILNFLHDDFELDIMYGSIENFLKTICEFYKEKVYYLDEDGYLDYDLDKECEIGRKINAGLAYWLE